MCVCWFVCWFVCFLLATRHLSTLRRCLRVAERAGAVVAGGRARAQACTARARARMPYNFYEKFAALMPFKSKSVRARPCCRIRNCRDFQKKGKRKPTCHFPSSVYSLPSLGVFTFRIVLNRILHKSSLLAPMHGITENQATYLHCGGEARAKKRARPPATCRKSVAVSLPEIFRGVNLLAD